MFGLFLSSFFLINVFLKSFPSLPLSLTLVLPHSLIISCPYSFPSFFFLILSFYLILSPSISSSHSLAVSHLTSFPLSYHHSPHSHSLLLTHIHTLSYPFSFPYSQFWQLFATGYEETCHTSMPTL